MRLHTNVLRRLARGGRLLLLLGWVACAPTAFATPARHPAPSVLHDYFITLTPQTLTVQAFLRISPELVPTIYRQIDQDADGTTSDAERRAWLQKHAAPLQISLDGVPQLRQSSAAPALSLTDLLVSINHPLTLTYTVALAPALQGSKHRIMLTYGDNYLAYDEYYVSITGDATSDGKPRGVATAHYPATYQIVYHLPAATDVGAPAPARLAPAPWTAGTPTVAPPVANQAAIVSSPAPVAPSVRAGSAGGPVLDMLRNWHGEIPAALGMLLLAAGLGALHALSPGHGKTLVAAYLVGTRGRVRDAVLLGGIVTITHTFGVILLGLALLVLTTLAFPLVLQPLLELISGGLVLLLGVVLLVQRGRALRPLRSSPVRVQTTVPVRVAQLHAVGAAGGGGTAPLQRRPLPPDPPSDRRPLHTHDAAHGHGHSAHRHAQPDETGPAGLRALVGLGISGGIVPCPDALAIILLAAAVGQVGLGLGLVTAFSLGLAAVLIGIGVVLVTMKGALARSGVARLAHNPWWTRGLPLISAALVTLIGILMIGAALPALLR